MIILFYVTMVAAAAFFLVTKRVFDFFSIAFLSCVIYFAPGFWGVSRYFVEGRWVDSEIVPEAYLVMVAVVVSLVFFAALYDASRAWTPATKPQIGELTPTRRREFLYLFLTAVVSAVALWDTA